MALTKAFAENGNRLAIPADATPDGSVSYDQGFGAFYALPPEEGGLFIDRAQFNQLMYDTTLAILENKAEFDGLFLTENVTKTVGAGGDFPSWVEAYEYCSRISPNTPYGLTLQLIAGCPPFTQTANQLEEREYPFLTITTNGVVISDFYNPIQLSAAKIDNFKIRINRNDEGFLLNFQASVISNCDINITTNSASRRMRLGSFLSNISIDNTNFTFNGTNSIASISIYHITSVIVTNCNFATSASNTIFIANRGSRIFIYNNSTFSGINTQDVFINEAGTLISNTCRATNIAANQPLTAQGQWIK